MAVLALGTILTAGVCVIVQGALDFNGNVIDGDDDGVCDTWANGDIGNENETIISGDPECVPHIPNPTLKGFFTAFSSIMFAFGGASTFPTIQADMKERRKFPIAALLGCSGKYLHFRLNF
jgi:amino acid transporter